MFGEVPDRTGNLGIEVSEKATEQRQNKTIRPRLHCTGTTSEPEQKLLRTDSIYTASVRKLYQIGGARSVKDNSEQCNRKADL